MLELIRGARFEKDVEKLKKRGKDMQKLVDITKLLILKKTLPPKNRNHKLSGNLSDSWECHIEPDWLLVYKKTDTAIILSRMGTHSDLF